MVRRLGEGRDQRRGKGRLDGELTRFLFACAPSDPSSLSSDWDLRFAFLIGWDDSPASEAWYWDDDMRGPGGGVGGRGAVGVGARLSSRRSLRQRTQSSVPQHFTPTLGTIKQKEKHTTIVKGKYHQ